MLRLIVVAVTLTALLSVLLVATVGPVGAALATTIGAATYLGLAWRAGLTTLRRSPSIVEEPVPV